MSSDSMRQEIEDGIPEEGLAAKDFLHVYANAHSKHINDSYMTSRFSLLLCAVRTNPHLTNSEVRSLWDSVADFVDGRVNHLTIAAWIHTLPEHPDKKS